MNSSNSVIVTQTVCPDADDVVAHVRKELDRRTDWQVRLHMQTCASCSQEVELLRPSDLSRKQEIDLYEFECPGGSVLRGYVNGEYTPNDAEELQIRHHLKRCGDCCLEVLAVKRWGCPSDEMLLNYAAKDLKDEDYHRIGHHLLRCDDCRETVVDLINRSQRSTA